mmetsp:Transcript_11848/g.37559  ORF Transcript_11848/g.37559 Transcript_11848/m.37559 type:complete len:231 (-) Transcript_11848:416-1108(-)
MAASCAPVPVRSTTMISLPSRPFFVPLTTSPSSACTSLSCITPAPSAARSSPTLDVCLVRSEMYLDAASTSLGISCLVGWSEPLAMIVTPFGLSQLFSSTVLPPGVCVKMTSLSPHSACADGATVNGMPSSACISLAKASAPSIAYATPLNGRTAAAPRAMLRAIAPQPMKPTTSCVADEQCFIATAPAAPVRRSVMNRFSWKMPSGAPVIALTTMKMPEPGGSPLALFL